MQILWIRHGKTLGNVQRRYVGRTDEGLTDEAKLCLQKKQVLMQDLCVQTEGGRNPGKGWKRNLCTNRKISATGSQQSEL